MNVTMNMTMNPTNSDKLSENNNKKNSKVFEQKGNLLNFMANIDPMAVLS